MIPDIFQGLHPALASESNINSLCPLHTRGPGKRKIWTLMHKTTTPHAPNPLKVIKERTKQMFLWFEWFSADVMAVAEFKQCGLGTNGAKLGLPLSLNCHLWYLQRNLIFFTFEFNIVWSQKILWCAFYNLQNSPWGYSMATKMHSGLNVRVLHFLLLLWAVSMRTIHSDKCAQLQHTLCPISWPSGAAPDLWGETQTAWAPRATQIHG